MLIVKLHTCTLLFKAQTQLLKLKIDCNTQSYLLLKLTIIVLYHHTLVNTLDNCTKLWNHVCSRHTCMHVSRKAWVSYDCMFVSGMHESVCMCIYSQTCMSACMYNCMYTCRHPSLYHSLIHACQCALWFSIIFSRLNSSGPVSWLQLD